LSITSADLPKVTSLTRAEAMSTFYLLPPRPLVAQFLADWASSLLPGLPATCDVGAGLAEALEVAITSQPDAFLVFREDLPDEVDPLQALVDGFGAERGDAVIEVGLSMKEGKWNARPQRLNEAA
jgi:hypothetical protein